MDTVTRPVPPWWVPVWPLVNIILLIVFLAASVYGFILFLKLARLGIQALKIYIEKNRE